MKVELGVVEIDLGNDKIELELDTIIPIGEDVSTEFRDQASLFAYIAMLAADAESLWRESKRLVEEVYAETDAIVREEYDNRGERTTEKRVEAEVQMRKGYREAIRFELNCHQQYLTMRVLQQALEMRANMLISLGAHLREEAKQTGMLIKDTKDRLDELRREKS